MIVPVGSEDRVAKVKTPEEVCMIGCPDVVVPITVAVNVDPMVRPRFAAGGGDWTVGGAGCMATILTSN
jgi:hypothetical protein